MNQYLTIREFARLRDVDINSLRYYEKLGLLRPAWVDPKTRYRYYLPEQLVALDIIILCIRLGIPLKNLKAYVDANGNFDKQAILEDGKAAMERRIAEMRLGLELIQFNLDSMERNQDYSGRTRLYTREIPERHLIVRPFEGDWHDVGQKEHTVMDLFHDAQERGLAPVFPAGILVHPDGGAYRFSFFFQVLHPLAGEASILQVPAGIFSCVQVDLTLETKLPELLAEHFALRGGETILIANMVLNKLHFNSRRSEIQVRLDTR